MSVYFRIVFAVLALTSTLPVRAQQAAPVPSGAASAVPAPSVHAGITSPQEQAKKLMADAIAKMKNNDLDGAQADLDHALQLYPNSTGAYVLRASIFTQKKEWPQAEADFKAAQKIAPTNVVLKFNLIEIQFMQKKYDEARPGFLALEKDPDVIKQEPDMVDFAAYKVFLCDLFAGHEDQAKKELDVFNDAMGDPSYYFGNAAWYLVHHQLDKAREWLLSASRVYMPSKNEFYSQSLRDLGYLPIPMPEDVVTTPTKNMTPGAQ
jgi:tetratricopeptide (TPR) repeat protein